MADEQYFQLTNINNTNIGLDSSGHAMFKDVSATQVFVYNHLKIPQGTTAERPSASTNEHHGYIRYNTTTSQFEGADNPVAKTPASGAGRKGWFNIGA